MLNRSMIPLMLVFAVGCVDVRDTEEDSTEAALVSQSSNTHWSCKGNKAPVVCTGPISIFTGNVEILNHSLNNTQLSILSGDLDVLSNNEISVVALTVIGDIAAVVLNDFANKFHIPLNVGDVVICVTALAGGKVCNVF